MRTALDPYMIRHLPLLELPAVVAELGYEWIELSPREDFIPPGTTARVHQHLNIGEGDGEVDFDELFRELKANGFDGTLTGCGSRRSSAGSTGRRRRSISPRRRTRTVSSRRRAW